MGQDRHQDPLTKAEIDAIVAKAPKRVEGSGAFDMTFIEARDAALEVARQRSEQRHQEQIVATQQIGKCVGAYYTGLVQAGMSEELAAKLAESYHQWMMAQLGIAADGVRAVQP